MTSDESIQAGSADETARRKDAHLDVVLDRNVASATRAGFEHIAFAHDALPELAVDEIELGCELFGRKLSAPILISSMTGGTRRGGSLNRTLAEAAQSLGLAIGVGSQRAALEDPGSVASFDVRSYAPDSLVFANLGAVQFAHGYGVTEARAAVEMAGADALIVHLNALQEAVQAEGDRDWRGVLVAIEQLVAALGDVPVVVKEVGHGISGEVAGRLADIGIAAIDVAGAGGTSWTEVEAHRHTDAVWSRVAHAFSGWGLPTAVALAQVRDVVPDIPVFASGGIRTGLDIAKALALGASLAGIAAPALAAAVVDTREVESELRVLIETLRVAMFGAGARDLDALRDVSLYEARTWQPLRGVDPQSAQQRGDHDQGDTT